MQPSPIRLRLILRSAAIIALTWSATNHAFAADGAVDRLTAERLAAVHQARLAFSSQRRDLPRRGPLRAYRANLHVHSKLSHDSRGSLDEILAAAKTVGTHVVLFTEHPAAHYDFVTDGHQGLRDGVLLIPGAETQGLLAFPATSVKGLDLGSPQEFSDVVRRRGGQTFLSHLEERLDWDLTGLSGVEIYNTHADVKDEKQLAAKLRNPLWLLTAAELIRKYPQEAFSALQDYPADYLKRWDELCARAPHTGVSANDAHQNIGLTIRLTEDKKARVEDALGKKLLELDASLIAPQLPPRDEGRPADGVLFQLRLDPYENSLRHVATHLLMTELSADAVRQALDTGRAFVAFDWIADSTGFDVAAESAGRRHEMGSRVTLADDLRITAQAPLAARWKLIRDGQRVAEHDGATYAVRVERAGRYRLELWLDVAGELRPWILTNPFYVVAP